MAASKPWDGGFTRSEFTCGCGCGFDVVDAELLEVLCALRSHFGTTVGVSSGARCRAHNAAIGGSKESQHILGKAADIYVKGVDASTVAEYLLQAYPDKYGIGLYNTWVHIDVRSTKARWGI